MAENKDIDAMKTIEQLARFQNDILDRKFDYLKNVVLLATGLFGILISLDTKSSINEYTRWCFACALVLIGAGILLATIALYGSVAVRIRALEGYKAKLEKGSKDSTVSKIPKRYAICQTCAYILFALGMTMLVLYAVLLAIYHR